MPDNPSRAEQFQAEVQQKIRKLLAEFGEGKISTEQFNILYERYNNQLALAYQVIDEDESSKDSELSTIAIREATAGKAIGMGIYHHRSGTIIETLGTFELPPDVISPVLNEYSRQLDAREFIEPQVHRLTEGGIWLVYMTRQYTTAIILFRNEPSKRQIREIERLLHDFEEANARFLDAQMVDPKKLGRPFLGFVRRKLK